MAACIIPVKYSSYAALFTPAGASFRVGSLKKEEKKHFAMPSYLSTPQRLFVLVFFCLDVQTLLSF
jgi:hypothetical protein